MSIDSTTLPDGLDTTVRSARRLLADAVHRHAPVALASSMGAEDMVLIDLVARDRLAIDIFVLDTGRLHQETYALIQEARAHYGLPFKIHTPSHTALESFLGAHGPDGLYRSMDVRKACCAIRKVEPLGRALAGYGAWVTGMRRGQSVTRMEIKEHDWDAANGLEKYNPLAAWSSEDVWAYIRAQGVPYNPLHDQGFASIGCAPCTRAIAPGANERSGRWWWEEAEQRECGLHVEDGRLAPASETREGS